MQVRSILFILGFVLSSVQLVAQKSDYPKSLWLGLRFGAHYSKYQFVPNVPQSQYLGKTIGLITRLEVERGASAQLEINYTQTGWLERFDAPELLSERQLSYVEMPFLAHLYLGKKALRVFVNIGPFLGYALSDKHIYQGDKFSDLQKLRQTMPIDNKFAWGLMAGPGLSLSLGRRHRLELEGRIAYNFQDVWNNSRGNAYSQSTELRMAASLAYYFRL